MASQATRRSQRGRGGAADVSGPAPATTQPLPTPPIPEEDKSFDLDVSAISTVHGTTSTTLIVTPAATGVLEASGTRTDQAWQMADVDHFYLRGKGIVHEGKPSSVCTHCRYV